MQIKTFEDFRAAFDRTFSAVPLQEEHPDWSAEIRSAIGQRHLLQGMTKRQAFYIVGMPARVAKSEENGKAIEIWTLQRQGIEFGYFSSNAADPGAPPETVRFEDGLLASADVGTAAGSQLDLDH